MDLKGRHRRHLRSLAHDLDPVVQVGKEGISTAVIDAVREALLAHELIKVKLPRVDKADRVELANSLEAATQAALVALTGRVAVLYRPHPSDPSIELPE